MANAHLREHTQSKTHAPKRATGGKPGNGAHKVDAALKKQIFLPVETVTKAIKINKDNAELATDRMASLMSVSAAYNRGLHDMQLAYVELFQNSMELMQRAMRDLVRCMSPADFAEVQQEVLRKGFDQIFEGTAKILRTSSKASEDATLPIQDQIGHAS